MMKPYMTGDGYLTSFIVFLKSTASKRLVQPVISVNFSKKGTVEMQSRVLCLTDVIRLSPMKSRGTL